MAEQFDPDAYLAETEQQDVVFDPDAYLADSSAQEKLVDPVPAWKKATKFVAEQLSLAGGVGGAMIGSMGGPVGAVAGGGLGAAAGKALENIIEGQVLDEAKTADEIYLDPIKEVPSGMLAEAGGQIIGKGLNKSVDYLAPKLAGAAEKLALKATGATGAQASKFRDGAGRELIDRKLVQFGDDAEKVSQRLQTELANSEKAIDESLSYLDSKGVTVKVQNIVDNLEKKIIELKQDASKGAVVKKLMSIVDDIKSIGMSELPISKAEQTKRGFNKMAGNWIDPEAGQAGKEAYHAFKKEVESTAKQYAPEISAKFKEAKNTYGLIAPIEEAATRRANTLNQSPVGGLLDMATVGAGGGVGGLEGAAAGVMAASARRVIAPRTASSMMAISETAANLLSNPRLKRFSETNPKGFNELLSNILIKKADESSGMTKEMLPPIPMMTPYELDQKIRRDKNLKPSEKYMLREQIKN